ncbi:MAG TPA: carbohydrate-binding protein [Verrucomicrobiae bacterium]
MTIWKKGRGWKAVLSGVCLLMTACLGYGEANNPLDKIPADKFDGKSPNVKLESCILGGKDICSIHDGGYVVYKHYDFDSGVAAFKASLATANEGKIEIRFDSLRGPVVGTLTFENTGGWQDWRDFACKVDNSQAGVRDIYLIFHGYSKKALVNVSSFTFLKSIVTDFKPGTSLTANRVDIANGELQATNDWGEPSAIFKDSFDKGTTDNWITRGMALITNSDDGALESTESNQSVAVAPQVYINKTDTGGDWRTLAEGSLSAEIGLGDAATRAGIGFASESGNQAVYVLLNPSESTVEVWRKLSDGSLLEIKEFDGSTNFNPAKCAILPEEKYRLQIDWSPFSNGLIAYVYDDAGNQIVNFRTVIDLPAARHPMLVAYGRGAHFTDVQFDPTLDDWDFKWQWKKLPVLTSDVCNPAVWKGKDGRYYMMWRKFGQDTYHGVASSSDGISWKRVNDRVLKCTGDMNVLVDPFGDGLVYATPGGANMAWYTSDGSHQFTVWKDAGINLGDIYGNSRIQEIIDTAKFKQLAPIHFEGADYRFIAFTENWIDMPRPHTVVLLSNTLTNWVLADPRPLIPPRTDFWGEKGSAIGAAIPLPDGNILVASCSCTFAGYTGASEPSNVSAIVDGRQPWKVLRLGTLPDAPVSRENVWYQGPNFGTAFYYEPENDTLFFYGGFHDYSIGMMRVQNFSHSKLFTEEKLAGVFREDRVKK